MKNETARKQPAQHTPTPKRFVMGGQTSIHGKGKLLKICRNGFTDPFVLVNAERLSAFDDAWYTIDALNAYNSNAHDALLASHAALVEALEAAMPHVRYKNQTSHILRTDVDLVLDKMEMALAQAKQVKA